MSHTNNTTNYGLPQFLSSDRPAWMADINVAFADIDAQMKTNADAASAAQTTADDAVLNGAPGYSNLSTYAVGDVVNYLGRVYKCDIAVTTPEAFDSAKWSYYRLSDASAQLDVIDSEIGSTDISGIGDGSITGALSAVNSNLSARANESYTITTTGCTASNNETYAHFVPTYIDYANNLKYGIAVVQLSLTMTDTTATISGLPKNASGSYYVDFINSYGTVDKVFQLAPNGTSISRSSGISSGQTFTTRCVYLAVKPL